MKKRTMVKLRAVEQLIIFKTVTRTRKSEEFYADSKDILSLESRDHVIVYDGSSFAYMCRSRIDDTVEIRFSWINPVGAGAFTGWEQTVRLPFGRFMDFVQWSVYAEQPQTWNALSLEPSFSPKFVFVGKRNLRQILADRKTSRKLFKFLRDHFQWRDCTEILFYDDYISRSFYFREMRNQTVGICGGLVLHGQKDMKTAYYSIHT